MTDKIGNIGKKAVFSAIAQFAGISTIAIAGAYFLRASGAGSAGGWLFAGGEIVAAGLALHTFFSLKKISRWMGGQATEIESVLEGMARGDYSSHSTSGQSQAGLYGLALQAKSSTKELLRKTLAKASEASRLRHAMNAVDANMMIVDADMKILSVNKSLMGMLHQIESEIRKKDPSFSPDHLVGKNINQLMGLMGEHHGLPAQQHGVSEGRIKLVNTDVKFIAHPIVSEKGVWLGSIIEWVNDSLSSQVESEINSVVASSLNGDLSGRVSLQGKSGFYQHISEGINDLLSVNEHVIGEISRVAKSLSQGRIDDKVNYDYSGAYDSLKKNLNQSTDNLRDVLVQVKSGSEEVTQGAQEISQGNNNLSQRTESQAANLERTAAAMEQMTGTVHQNAENANQANALASQARTQAEKGGGVLGKAVSSMAEINSASKKISDIIGVIDEIAFQTNLLALNAAVEAAHAGDQGRGFAVVASEVRNLAQRSAEAAKEIKGLIEDSVQKVESGTQLVDESGHALQEIVVSVKKVSDIIAEIAAANREQSIGIDQVNQSVMKMDEMTQQNASLVREVAESSEALGEQAHGLNELLSFFAIDGSMPIGSSQASVSAAGSMGERRGADRPWSSGAGSSGGSGVDIAAAKSKHLSWKTRIRSFLDGGETLTKEQAVSHRDCDLGKWIYSEGLSAYGSMPEMQSLEEAHAKMHGEIKKIIELKTSGKDSEAEQRYVNIEKGSNEVVGFLSSIEREIEGNQPAAQSVKMAAAGGSDWAEF